MNFSNVYEDSQRANAYAKLEFPGTYYLAFRDIPYLIQKYVKGNIALDFGCGTGRSTRFLHRLGFDCIGLDISREMIGNAQSIDPEGTYLLVKDGDLGDVGERAFDLVFSAFTFDNIANSDHKLRLLKALRRKLRSTGIMINLVSSPKIYVNEWVSFTTKDFPGNRLAKNGDIVKIIMLDVEDNRPVEDILFTEAAYRDLYFLAGYEELETYHPLGKQNDNINWKSESLLSPWCIYVLANHNK